jgi:CheY-like chemotaxis protein
MLGMGGRRQFPTLLLIDDDMVSREVMATVLTMGGYTVHTAVNGDDALESLAQDGCAPDVILMDAQMPGLSGTRLIEELRARSQAAVIAISGSSAPGRVEAAADGFLLKPFGAEDLHKLLDEHEAQTRPAATPALDPDEPVVNAETLAQLLALMPPAAVRQIYGALLADLESRTAALEAVSAKGDMAEGDIAEIRRIGHAIKGGCGMAGAQQLASLGARLEALNPASNQLDNTTSLLADLHAATQSLKRMLETEFIA